MEFIEELEKAISTVLPQEYELVDIEFDISSDKPVLRVYIDKEGGIELADCEKVTGIISPLLDELDVIKCSYLLEVSSPSIYRVLKKPEHFIKFIGHNVRIKLKSPINNVNEISGKIESFKDGRVIVRTSFLGVISVDFSNIEHANLELNVEEVLRDAKD